MRQKTLNTSTVQKYKDTNFTNLVFPSKKNQPFHDMVILESIHNVIAKMAADGVYVEKFGPHTFRHTFATRAIVNDMNPKTLQYLMGHSEIGVTLNTYTHMGYDDAKEELKRVANAE